MRTNVFNEIIKNSKYFPSKNKDGKILQSMNDFIDDLLETEDIRNFSSCLEKDIFKVSEENQEAYTIVYSFIEIIKGLDSSMLIEAVICNKELDKTDFAKRKQLEEDKIRYIKNFVNYLFLND